jgi:endoglycosylceramidase
VKRLAVLCTLIATVVLAPQASAAPQLPLDHTGRWFTDGDGRVVVLHGLNMVYKRAPYAPDAIGFGDDDAAFLASEGYNTVRLGLIYKAIEPQPGQYDEAYLDRIQNTVNTLGRHGIVSLLDFHQDLYNEKFQGEGFPDWAVQDDGLPNPENGFPGNYLSNPALNRAFDHFWANDPGPGGVGLQDRYAAAWRHVADRFKDNRYVLGYDLLNEPWPGTTWPQCANTAGCPEFDAKLSDFVQRVRTAIRTVDPSTLVFYEPNVLFNNGADTNLANFGDKNAAMSFHDYCLTANEGGGGYGQECQKFDSMVFDNADKRSAATGDALLLTEFGATDDRASLLGPLTLADQHMTSWQEWHYCGCDDPTTTGSGDTQAIVLDPNKPPSGDNLKTTTLDVLSRPYPRLVAGRPDSWAFDPDTHQFTFGYDPRQSVDGSQPFGFGIQSEIVMPERQYPHGYAPDVRGGAILSAPGARILRVTACSAADVVFLTVVPGSGTPQSSCAVRTPFNAISKLGVRVSPSRVRVKRKVTVKVVVRAGPKRKVVRGAMVRLAGRRAVTSRSGRAVFHIRFRHTGRRTVVARARGYEAGKATLRVVGR